MRGMGIVKQLQTAIKEDGRTLRALARDSGVSPIQISRFQRNERGLNTPAVEALCEALGLELAPKRRKRAGHR